MMKALWKFARRLHSDERGAEGLEKLLIIAAVVLPLLGLLIYFSGEISDWSQSLWNTIRGEAESTVQHP